MVKNVILSILAIIFIVVGLVIIANTSDIVARIIGTILAVTPLIWMADTLCYWWSWPNRIVNWISSNQDNNVPPIYIGYENINEVKKISMETIRDMAECEIELQQKKEELARALARGKQYKTRSEYRMWCLECEIAAMRRKNEKTDDTIFRLKDDREFLVGCINNLRKDNANLRNEVSFLKLINWADKTHQRQA